jgi:hypothetical protein
MRTDARAFALYARHYSAAVKRNDRYRRRGNTNIVGPMQHMVLLSLAEDALFVWTRATVERDDHQRGVCCAVFRNEGPVLSSELVREADDLAWQRWPDEARHFTYVDGAQVRHKRDPGRCFLRAGWRTCGRNADGRLTMLERIASSDPLLVARDTPQRSPF